MDNGGFCNDNYHSLSSDDELVDISDVTVDFSEDVPPLIRDYSVGRDTLTRHKLMLINIGCTVRFISAFIKGLYGFARLTRLFLVFKLCFINI